jgi:Rieske Fe-S protein
MESKLVPQESSSPEPSRRSFLGVLLGTASTFVAALLSVPVLRYVLYPLTAKSAAAGWSAAGPESEATAAVGPLSRTLHITEQDGWRETRESPLIYLVKKGTRVQALSAICPHLGCVLPWDANRKEFVCPCHGGVFGPDGAYRAGPSRRSMDSLKTQVTNGQVMVQYETFRPDVPNKQVTS